jgi:hypothetical protein
MRRANQLQGTGPPSQDAINIDDSVKGQNNDVSRVRYRHGYRKLNSALFDPDTDSDPDADKPGMVL